MRMAGNIVSIILVLLGILWILQGSNMIGGSVMSGKSMWLWIGVVALLAGAIGGWWFNLRKRG